MVNTLYALNKFVDTLELSPRSIRFTLKIKIKQLQLFFDALAKKVGLTSISFSPEK
jgi:hypothetical protein